MNLYCLGVTHNSFLFSFQFVTRAVRVIDLITNLDMHAFQSHGGLNAFTKRLEVRTRLMPLLLQCIYFLNIREASSQD